MIRTITKTWTFTTAQTNLAIVSASSLQRISVTLAKANCANSNSVDVSIRVGLAAATLPAVVNDSATGEDGVFLSSGGIARGGGEVNANGGAPIAVGNPGDDIYVTASVATGGSLKLMLTYWIDDVTPS